MAKVCTAVNLLDPEFKLVTLLPGDDVPDWAVDRITNPSVILADVAPAISAEALAQPELPEVPKLEDYKGFKKAELAALAQERGIVLDGEKVDEIRELLIKADAEAAAALAAAYGDQDVFDLEREQLEELAEKRGVEFDDDTSDDELAQLIDNAGE